MHDLITARAPISMALGVSNRGRRLRAALFSMALVGSAMSWPAAAAAADNVPPVAVDDPGTACQSPGAFGGSFPIAEDYGRFDFAGSCSAIANDTDPDGSIVSWQIVTPPAHGTLQYLANFPGVFGYTAAANFNTPAGDWVSDSFTYRVVDNVGALSNVATMRIWVAPINDAPRFVTLPTVDVLVNSGSYDASWLPYVSPGPADESTQSVAFFGTSTQTNQPSLFSVPPAFTSDGRLIFTPAPDQSGFALVSVHLQDDGGLENYGIPNLPQPPRDTAGPFTFRIRVNFPNRGPVAVNDSATVNEDAGATPISVLANDFDLDNDALTIVAHTNGSQGQVTVNAAATAVTYSPNANMNGTDTFTYTIHDGIDFSTATVTVTITPVNDPPVVLSDTATIDEDSGANRIEVLANDTDIDGGTLRVIGATNGAKGSVAIVGDGPAVTYTPNANANGSDSFTYTIGDGNGGTATATVAVSITPVNDQPVAADDGAVTPIKIGKGAGPVTIDALVNDTTAPDIGEVLQITSVTQASHGTVAIGPGGLTLTYDPAGQTTGLDVFTYTISDGQGGFDTATVRVEVTKTKPPK